MNGVSIIVCCYNSATRIEETLQFLFDQKTNGGFPWEIIVVDNASKDDTRAKVESLQKMNATIFNLILVEEPIPGLANARKRGENTASYNLIVFCDDDNQLSENYVQTAFDLMMKDSSIGIAGGCIRPKLPFYPGKWIEGNYAALAIGERADKSGYIDWVFGAGMVIRKSIFTELEKRGISFLLSGRLGLKQTYGDDAEMCYLTRFIGYKIYYSADLILYHKIAAHRLTKSSFLKANVKNVFPMVYFHLLEKMIFEKSISVSREYWVFMLIRIRNLFYFLPRTIFGRYRFFSFMMLFQSIQLVGWMLARRSLFYRTYDSIKANLYLKNGLSK